MTADDIVIPIERIHDDMIIEIMKKIPGIPLERTKQTCKELLKVADNNAKALSVVGCQRGLNVLLYVDRWEQGKLRLQQTRNYAPDFTTGELETKMKGVPISAFTLNFTETEEVERLEDLIQLLNNVQPTCYSLEVKGVATEFLPRILKSIDCKREITILQKGADDQLLITTLREMPFVDKINVIMESSSARDRHQLPEFFLQIKKFRSFVAQNCTTQTFHDLISELQTATDYANLKEVTLNMDFNNRQGNNDYANENLPAMEKLWDSQPLPQDRRDHTVPTAIRKFESKTKFILISERSSSGRNIVILEKKYSELLKALLKQLNVNQLSEEKQEEFCNVTTTDERRAEMIQEAFLAKPKKATD